MSPGALKRRLERLAIQNEATIASDKRFFERFPDRRYRVRLASTSEVETTTILTGLVPAPGSRLFAAVFMVSPEVRQRAMLYGAAANAAHLDGLGEAEARALYERHARSNPQFREIERATVAAFGAGGSV